MTYAAYKRISRSTTHLGTSSVKSGSTTNSTSERLLSGIERRVSIRVLSQLLSTLFRYAKMSLQRF